MLMTKILLTASLMLCLLFRSAFGQVRNDSIAMHGSIGEVRVNARKSHSVVSSLTDGVIRLDMRQGGELPRFAGGIDPMRVLQLMPGVQTAGDGDSGFFVRGGDAGQSAVTLNGAPLYSYAHLFGFISAFNPGHIATFELDKRGTGSSSGLRAHSVETLTDKWSLKGDVGVISSQATLSVPLGGKASLYLSARRSYAEWLIALIMSDDDDLRYALQDYDATLVWEPGNRHKLVVNAHYGDDRVRTGFDKYNFDGRIAWHNSASSLRLESKLTPRLSMENTLYFSDYANRLDVSTVGESVHSPSSIADAGYKGEISRDSEKIALRAGLQYAYRIIAPQYISADYNLVSTSETVPRPRFGTHEAAAYAEVGWKVRERLQIDLTLRYGIYRAVQRQTKEVYRSCAPEGGVSIAYRLSERTRFSASYSLGVQYTGLVPVSNISFSTDFWTAATAKNPPMRSHNLTAGYYGTLLGGRLRLSAEVYYRRMYHVLEYNMPLMSMIHNVTDITDHIYSGDGEACGIEMMAVYSTPRLSCWLGYTLARSVRRFDRLNGGNPFPAKQDRRHDLSLAVTWHPSPRWDVGAVFVYASGAAFTSPTGFYLAGGSFVRGHGSYNGSRLPDYHRLDLSVTRWLGREGARAHGINLSLYNAYARKNPLYVSWPIHYSEAEEVLKASRRKHYIYTIIPSLSWIFRF